MAFGIDDAIAAALKILDKFVPDPQARQTAESELRSSLQLWDKGQTDVNAVEAANPNVFVSGWRPFIGWVCGLALAYQYVAAPILMWLATTLGITLASPPKLDDTLWQLVFAMLGIGGLRTFEKIKGVARK
jgi:hypothetical protein